MADNTSQHGWPSCFQVDRVHVDAYLVQGLSYMALEDWRAAKVALQVGCKTNAKINETRKTEKKPRKTGNLETPQKTPKTINYAHWMR